MDSTNWGGRRRGAGPKPKFGSTQKQTTVRLPEPLQEYLRERGLPASDTIREALELHRRLQGALLNAEKDKFYAYWVDRSASGALYLWQSNGVLLGCLVWGEKLQDYTHQAPHGLQVDKAVGRRIPIEQVGKLPQAVAQASGGFVGYQTFQPEEEASITLSERVAALVEPKTEDFLYEESQVDLSEDSAWDASSED